MGIKSKYPLLLLPLCVLVARGEGGRLRHGLRTGLRCGGVENRLLNELERSKGLSVAGWGATSVVVSRRCEYSSAGGSKGGKDLDLGVVGSVVDSWDKGSGSVADADCERLWS